MKYNLEALKAMVDNYTMNIEMFQGYYIANAETPHQIAKNNANAERIATMVANRRLIAAMIENEGEAVVPNSYRYGNVFFDSMLYSAKMPDADTSWWTKGS